MNIGRTSQNAPLHEKQWDCSTLLWVMGLRAPDPRQTNDIMNAWPLLTFLYRLRVHHVLLRVVSWWRQAIWRTYCKDGLCASQLLTQEFTFFDVSGSPVHYTTVLTKWETFITTYALNNYSHSTLLRYKRGRLDMIIEIVSNHTFGITFPESTMHLY
jgi:hypothetical protein